MATTPSSSCAFTIARTTEYTESTEWERKIVGKFTICDLQFVICDWCEAGVATTPPSSHAEQHPTTVGAPSPQKEKRFPNRFHSPSHSQSGKDSAPFLCLRPRATTRYPNCATIIPHFHSSFLIPNSSFLIPNPSVYSVYSVVSNLKSQIDQS